MRGCGPAPTLHDEVHVGNFVEVKASTLGRGVEGQSSRLHRRRGRRRDVNFGAGSITANYDGANKHRTVIGDDAQHRLAIACSSRRSTVGAGATIGGGSTIARDAPPAR